MPLEISYVQRWLLEGGGRRCATHVLIGTWIPRELMAEGAVAEEAGSRPGKAHSCSCIFSSPRFLAATPFQPPEWGVAHPAVPATWLASRCTHENQEQINLYIINKPFSLYFAGATYFVPTTEKQLM